MPMVAQSAHGHDSRAGLLVHDGAGHHLIGHVTFKHIVKVQELLFIIKVVIVCFLLTVVAL